MHVLCDFSMFCLNFYTLLDQFGLTYQLSAPSCQFLFSAVFVFQVFRLLKVLRKFRENYIKNQRDGSLRSSQERQPGATTRDKEGPWRDPTLGRARRPPGFLVGPLDAPPSPIFTPLARWIPFSRTHLCSAAAAVSRSGLPGEAAPGPCRKEKPPPGDHP